MTIKIVYKLNSYKSSLLSRKMAQQEVAMSVSRLEPQRPLSHTIELRGRAKPILVRRYVIASEHDSSFFSANLLFSTSCFIVRVADGSSPTCRSV